MRRAALPAPAAPLVWLLCAARGGCDVPTGFQAEHRSANRKLLSRRLWGLPNVPNPGDLVDQTNKFVDNTKNQAGKLAGEAGKHAGEAGKHATNIGNEAGKHATNIGKEAGKHATNIGNQVGDTVNKLSKEVLQMVDKTFSFVKDTFNNAKNLVQEGIRVVTGASNASTSFTDQMTHLFKDFTPLTPIFGATHGMVPLVTSRKNLGTLVDFLVNLLANAAQLAQIGDAVTTVTIVFNKLFGLFNTELQNLTKAVSDAVEKTGGRRLFVDYTALLGGLNFNALRAAFEEFGRKAKIFVDTVKDISAAMSPLLKKLKHHVGGRRLTAHEAIEEVKKDQAKYEGAILNVVPTWQSVEGLAIEVCGQADTAIKEVTSLQCRVQGFAGAVQLPGTGGLDQIVGDCEGKAQKEADHVRRECPGVSQSASVRDMLSENAGVLGWIAVTFEYIIENTTATRIIIGVLHLLLGLAIGFFGYRYKDCEFWIEGFLAGMVVWSIVTSVVIVYFGVCRGEGVIDTCEPRWLLVFVVALSIGCAIATVKGQKIQLFLSGFDLGAIVGGCLYMGRNHERIFHTFVTVDTDETKVIMGWFLASAVLVGVVLGALTVFCAKPVIIVGTSAIGGFLIMISVMMFFPHWLDWGDLVGWLCITAFATVVQFLVTAHKEGETNSSSEEGEDEEKPLNE